MAYEPLTTTGGNGYLGGNGTFAQIVAGWMWIAQNRDQLDANQKIAWEQAANTAELNAKAYSDGRKWLRPGLNSSSTINALTDHGVYPVASSATASALGLPNPSMGYLFNYYVNSFYAKQTWTPMGKNMPVSERVLDNGTWGPWTKVKDPAPAGLANSLLVGDFTRRVGPVTTGGKGAVALRFDHGLGNFRDIILPLLQARGLVGSVALNSRNWELAENGGATATDVNTWVTNGDVEVWNHGAHHTNATSTAELEDTIIGGLTELRAQIPAASIDGFVVPGVGAGGYGGFDGGQTPSAFYGTEAGRIILANHAVSTGHYPGTAHRLLDGAVRQGQNHYTMDAVTLSSIVKTQIDQAVTDRTGLQLMLHPSQLNQTSRMTTATFTAVLDYIVEKRDAGELVALSPYELMVADASALTITEDPAVPGTAVIGE